MTDQTEARRVAAGLSRSMMEAVSGPVRHRNGDTWVATGLPATIRALEQRGLTIGAVFLPFGLAVRAVLAEAGK